MRTPALITLLALGFMPALHAAEYICDAPDR